MRRSFRSPAWCGNSAGTPRPNANSRVGRDISSKPVIRHETGPYRLRHRWRAWGQFSRRMRLERQPHRSRGRVPSAASSRHRKIACSNTISFTRVLGDSSSEAGNGALGAIASASVPNSAPEPGGGAFTRRWRASAAKSVTGSRCIGCLEADGVHRARQPKVGIDIGVRPAIILIAKWANLTTKWAEEAMDSAFGGSPN